MRNIYQQKQLANAEKKIYRTLYLDYLRITATFAVMILHVASQNWHTTDVYGLEWNVFNIYDSCARWGVPVFVMISGTLFLKKNISIRKIYSKYIPRMLVSFIVWSFVYALIKGGGIKDMIKNIILGHYHMWFIPMIVGIYICIPLIQPIIQKRENIRYFLILSFIFVFVMPQIVTMSNDFLSGSFQSVISALNSTIQSMNLKLIMGYTSYFILGYYLDSVRLSKRQQYIIYFLGVIGCFFTIFLCAMISRKMQSPNISYYNNFRVHVLFESVAVFVWFKYHVKDNRKIAKVVTALSKYSFGAYLVHVLIIWILKTKMDVTTLTFPAIVAVPMISMIVFCFSFGISAVLNHILILKKYIV